MKPFPSDVISLLPYSGVLGRKHPNSGRCKFASVVRSLCLFLGLQATVFAKLSYENRGGAITITRCDFADREVTVPSVIDGRQVNAIGYAAFSGCTNLVAVTTPDSITNIAARAFLGCSNLKKIAIQRTVTGIGNSAFANCTTLASIDVDSRNPVYVSSDGILFNKDLTTLLQCPGGRQGSYTFPSSVMTVGDLAFWGCSSVVDIFIPTNVSSLGNSAFIGCSNLGAINADPKHPNYASVDGVLMNKSLTALIQCPEGKTGHFSIPSSVSYIGRQVFRGCARLEGITIPNTVTGIGDLAFNNCAAITTVSIPKGVTSIGEQAFSFCTKLANVEIPSSVANLGRGAFAGCTSLPRLTIPDRITSIADSTFADCSRLTEFTIPSGVTTIGTSAFSGCSSLPNLLIPPSVTNIGSFAFAGCASFTHFVVPDGIASIGSGTFYFCTNLATVDLPSSVTSIGERAFSHCTSLARLAIPNHVQSIGAEAFSSCLSLTSLLIPNGVTTIQEHTFTGCLSLRSVTVPGSVTVIGDAAFSGCPNLERVCFGANAPTLLSGSVFDLDDNLIVYYLPGMKGWETTFGNHPTAYWSLSEPIILTKDSNLGVTAREFGFVVSWATNRPVIVEACADIAAATWAPVSTNTFAKGLAYFRDSQWTNYPARFYRLRTP